MSDASDTEFNCQMCSKTCSTREDITLHFQQHLKYKKFSCEDCNELFYSEASREEHCLKLKHHHVFRMQINQYNEMLLSMFLKDLDHLRIHDPDVVIAHRAKFNSEIDSALQSRTTIKFTPKHVKAVPKAAINTPRVAAISPNNSPLVTVTAKKASSLSSEKLPSNSDSSNNKECGKRKTSDHQAQNEERKRHRSSSANEMPSNVVLPFSDAIDTSLKTIATTVKCRLCSSSISSDYVSRKHHVSGYHMGADHDDVDYVSILESKMQSAFVGMTFNDIQCQWVGCGKEYRSNGGRRGHIVSHIHRQLPCPLTNCSYQDSESKKVNDHLKQIHDFVDGYRSLPDKLVRSVFEQKYKAQIKHIEDALTLAFPCSIPPCHANPRSCVRPTAVSTISDVLKDIPRAYQKMPNMPIRRLSESSDSEAEHSNETKKKKEDEKKNFCEEDKKKSHTGKGIPLAEKSDDEDNVVQFSEIKNETEISAESSKQSENNNTEINAQLGHTDKVPALPVNVSDDSSSDSDNDIEYLKTTTRKSKKKRALKESSEIKKEDANDVGSLSPTRGSNDGPLSLTEEEMKQEMNNCEDTKESLSTTPKRSFINESSSSKRSNANHVRPWNGTVAASEDVLSDKSKERHIGRYQTPTEHSTSFNRHSKHSVPRKKGSELNMSLENQRPFDFVAPESDRTSSACSSTSEVRMALSATELTSHRKRSSKNSEEAPPAKRRHDNDELLEEDTVDEEAQDEEVDVSAVSDESTSYDNDSQNDSVFLNDTSGDLVNPHFDSCEKALNQAALQEPIKKPPQLTEDLCDGGDPDQLWNVMCKKDEIFHVDLKSLVSHVEAHPRAVLIDWIMEVCESEKQHRETFHLAVNYIDKFLATVEFIDLNNLQCLGTSALLIASKYEEIYPPRLEHLVEYTAGACKVDEVQQMELHLLETLHWSLSVMTSVHWLHLFFTLMGDNHTESDCHVSDDRPVIPKFLRDQYVNAAKVLDVAVLDAEHLRFSYRQLAAGVLFLCYEPYQLVQKVTGYSYEELAPVIEWLRPCFNFCIKEQSLGDPLPVVPDVPSSEWHSIQTHDELTTKDAFEDVREERRRDMLRAAEAKKKINKRAPPLRMRVQNTASST